LRMEFANLCVFIAEASFRRTAARPRQHKIGSRPRSSDSAPCLETSMRCALNAQYSAIVRIRMECARSVTSVRFPRLL
jgi:hypothetical protein